MTSAHESSPDVLAACAQLSDSLSTPERHALAAVFLRALDPVDRMGCLHHAEDLLSADEQAVVEGLFRDESANKLPGNASLGLIVKVTRNCNLRCVYCHDWWSGPGSRMSFDVAAHTVAKALRDPKRTAVHFMWHGGETLVLPMSFYRKLLFLQSQFRKPYQTVQNSIQTNATLITPEWAEFLKANGFNVGVSLDGPREIHDAARVDARGRPTFDRVVAGIELLREAGVPFSVLMVVDDQTIRLGARALYTFLSELRLNSVGLIAAKPVNIQNVPTGEAVKHYVEPRRFNRFLSEMYDLCYADPFARVRIRELEGIRNKILANNPGFCTLAGNCLGQFYSVEPNGDVAHCDLYVGDERYTLGNIVNADFEQIATSPKLNSLKQNRASELDVMRQCSGFHICNGWCPHEKYLASRYDSAKDDACCGLLSLIKHVEARLIEEENLLPLRFVSFAPT